MTSQRGSGARGAKVSAVTFTVLALVFCGISVVLLAKYMSRGSYGGEPSRGVVVAAKNIEPSVVIGAEHLKVVQWPISSIPKGAYAKVDDVLDAGKKSPLNTITTGEPVLPHRMSSPSGGSGMAPLVPNNQRGFPVRVDSYVADAKLVYPGATVDVLATLQVARGQDITKIVVQNATVLAVNGAVDGVEHKAQTEKKGRGGRNAVVTLLVNPDQAEALAFVSRRGQLDLALRRAGDDAVVETPGTLAMEVLGLAREEIADRTAEDAGTTRRGQSGRRGAKKKRAGSRLSVPRARRSMAKRRRGNNSNTDTGLIIGE